MMILLHLVLVGPLHRIFQHHLVAEVAIHVVATVLLCVGRPQVFDGGVAAVLDVLAHLRHALHFAFVFSAQECGPGILLLDHRHLGRERCSSLQ